jgi:pseudouridine synthase
VKDFVFPVGRLDQDTTGLLILTNDSTFGDHITSPESKVPKTYLVKASVLLDDAQLDQLRQGLTLSDGPTRPALVQRIRDGAKYSFFEITITEGRNRQVRRMVEALGAKVLKLVRTAIGDIEIGPLEIGKYRPLETEEIAALGGTATRPSHAGRPVVPQAARRDRKAPQAPRRNGKSARWASESGRHGHNGSARKR